MSKFYDILQNHPGIFQAGDMGTLLNTGRRVPPSLCLCVWSVDKTVKLCTCILCCVTCITCATCTPVSAVYLHVCGGCVLEKGPSEVS